MYLFTPFSSTPEAQTINQILLARKLRHKTIEGVTQAAQLLGNGVKQTSHSYLGVKIFFSLFVSAITFNCLTPAAPILLNSCPGWGLVPLKDRCLRAELCCGPHSRQYLGKVLPASVGEPQGTVQSTRRASYGPIGSRAMEAGQMGRGAGEHVPRRQGEAWFNVSQPQGGANRDHAPLLTHSYWSRWEAWLCKVSVSTPGRSFRGGAQVGAGHPLEFRVGQRRPQQSVQLVIPYRGSLSGAGWRLRERRAGCWCTAAGALWARAAYRPSEPATG